MASILETLAVETEPCNSVAKCLNGPEFKAPALSLCKDCRLAEEGGGTGNHWRPADQKFTHPVLEQEKRKKKIDRKKEKDEKKAGRDQNRMKVVKNASRSEKKTQKDLVRATANSGRLRKDGDYKLTAGITLDNKHNSTEIHPKVDLAELDKVREDSRRAGTYLGGLVLKNKFGRGVVAFDLADIGRFIDFKEHNA